MWVQISDIKLVLELFYSILLTDTLKSEHL